MSLRMLTLQNAALLPVMAAKSTDSTDALFNRSMGKIRGCRGNDWKGLR